MQDLIGRILGHYRIVEKIGAGGMGEVYRATDERLDRDVAIKVLPEEVAEDSIRLSRFEREAKLLASLSHQNIATLYGLEESDGQSFLMMELVEGGTLATRILKGPIPIDEALDYACQIAEGLEVAHEKGIIHRDLKPANVMLSSEGGIKILDFGLAKAFEPAGSEPSSRESIADSPTLTAAMTRTGVLLGTAAYMSPEQARGKAVDKRADVWAFGCVLFEMLTGRKAFPGDDASQTMAAILRDDPEWTALPLATPDAIRKLLNRCLTKDPRDRLHDVADARIEIGDAMPRSPKSTVGAAAGSVGGRSIYLRLPLMLLIAGLVVTAATAGFFVGRDRLTQRNVVKLPLPAPFGTTYHLKGSNPGPVAVSPNGKALVFSARERSRVVFSSGNVFSEARLYLRPLDAAEAQPLAGTEGAQYPFWSPDSGSIGFFANGKLKKIDASGGPSITLCDAPNGTGGSWGPSGKIIFAPTPDGPIHLVSEPGGKPKAVTRIDRDRGDRSHRHPKFLPDGRNFLFLSLTEGEDQRSSHSVMAASLVDDGETVLLQSPAAVDFASGHLLYVHESTLMARPFDPEKMEFRGDPVPVCEDILVLPGAAVAVFSVSSTDVLACQSAKSSAGSSLTWFDRNGRKIGTLGEPAEYGEVLLSPDGAMAAVGKATPLSEDTDSMVKQTDIWIYSVDREVASRVTFDPNSDDQIAWSPDGDRIAFGRRLPRSPDIYVKSVDEAKVPEPLFESELYALPTSWSPDGKLLAFDSLSPETGWDQWILPLNGDDPFPFLRSPFNEADGVFSPDGRWMAYESDESGRWEIYITSFPGPGQRWRVSPQGGVAPRWNSSGRELFYRSATGDVMGVAVDLNGDSVVIGTPELLIEGQLTITNLAYQYSPAPGGEKFLLVTDRPETRPLNIILNWTAAITR